MIFMVVASLRAVSMPPSLPLFRRKLGPLILRTLPLNLVGGVYKIIAKVLSNSGTRLSRRLF